MSDVATPAHQETAGQFRQVLADYESIRDAYSIGAYTVGMNPQSDYAIQHQDPMNVFLRQGNEPNTLDQTIDQLAQVFQTADSQPATTPTVWTISMLLERCDVIATR